MKAATDGSVDAANKCQADKASLYDYHMYSINIVSCCSLLCQCRDLLCQCIAKLVPYIEMTAQ
jgi:hypothetical protein